MASHLPGAVSLSAGHDLSAAALRRGTQASWPQAHGPATGGTSPSACLQTSAQYNDGGMTRQAHAGSAQV